MEQKSQHSISILQQEAHTMEAEKKQRKFRRDRILSVGLTEKELEIVNTAAKQRGDTVRKVILSAAKKAVFTIPEASNAGKRVAILEIYDLTKGELEYINDGAMRRDMTVRDFLLAGIATQQAEEQDQATSADMPDSGIGPMQIGAARAPADP